MKKEERHSPKIPVSDELSCQCFKMYHTLCYYLLYSFLSVITKPTWMQLQWFLPKHTCSCRRKKCEK